MKKSVFCSDQSRFLKEYGFVCDFKLLDDFNQCREAWKTDKIDVMYATVDGFVTEVGGLKDLEPQIFFQCDWSRGGDAIVVRRGINSVADLEGKKVAFAEMTASHTFLLWMLEAGNLDYNKITPVKVANGLEAADLFKKGQVDAAVVWSDPNMLKKLLFLFLFILPMNMLFAQTVSVDKASTVARTIYLQQYPQAAKILGQEIKPELAYTCKSLTETYYYVFNIPQGGFVIVSGNEAVAPVLGYSFEGSFLNGPMPPACQHWLKDYQDRSAKMFLKF